MLQRELRKLIWPFLVPSLLLYLVIVVLPNVEALYWALTEYDGIAPRKTFVGLSNFEYMLGDRRWWSAAANTVYLAVGSIVTILPCSLLFAVLITNLRRGQEFFKTTIYLPNVLSMVIVALLWVFILDPTIGLLNEVLKTLHLEEPLKRLLGVSSLNWLGSPKLAKPTIVVIELWRAAGFYTLIFMAGLTKIPNELLDAAKIDGATGWSEFWHVVWPLLYPTTQTVFLLLVMRGLQVFALVYVLGGGGILPMTQVMSTYIYRTAFLDRRFGYATALSSVLMVVVMSLTVLSRRLTSREVVEF
jgi:ABC-type sugar transport system permease subunit